MKLRIPLVFCCILLAIHPARAQFYSAGTDPGSVRWSEVRSPHWRVIYPQGTDSLARAYLGSLEGQYARVGRSIGYDPCAKSPAPMKVILHPYTTYGNGMVMWAPRRMELYTVGDARDPDPLPWMLNLTTHEPRHASQLQFGRQWPFRALYYLTGELSDVVWWALYPGIVFSEGDAVAAETGLTDFGRGRSADFLEYMRVAFDEGDWRDYYRWCYGSQKLYTPDHYRAGYLLAAGMRTVWDEPLFTRKYYDNLFHRTLPLPFFNMAYTVREVSGLRFGDAFRQIETEFQAIWAQNDSLRAPFVSGVPLIAPAPGSGKATRRGTAALRPGEGATPGAEAAPGAEARRFFAFRGATAVGDDIYAVETGLERPARLVRIAPDGSRSYLGPFSTATSDLRYADGRLYWSEELRDPRWSLAGTSVIRSLDLSTRRQQTLLGGSATRPLGDFLPEGNNLPGPVLPGTDAGACGPQERVLLPPGGRFYNPAPTDDGTLLAAMHFATDGSHQIVIVDGRKGLSQLDEGTATLSILPVPAGMQPAQGAWIGERLYISAVTDAGFGLYEATDHFRCVLPGRPVKIRELRAQDDQLWFVCDKDGSDEWYSLSGPEGDGARLWQRTSLRHGGREFLRNAAGDTLRYAVLSTGGRTFYQAPMAAFRCVESDWDAVWEHPVARKLSEQERALACGSGEGEMLRCAQQDCGPATDWGAAAVSRPYRKAAHLLHFHTWVPLYVDYDAIANQSLSSLYQAATLGATAFFQNDLGTSTGSIGYSARRAASHDWEHLLDLRWNYSGLVPVIESSLTLRNASPSRYQFLSVTGTDGVASSHISATSLSAPTLNFSTRIYVPLAFNSGGWNRGLIPQLRYSLSNGLFDSSIHRGERLGAFPQKDRSLGRLGVEPGPLVPLQSLSASLRGYVMLPLAASGVYPRWGIGAEAGARARPALSRIYDPTVYGYLYGYLPGFLPEHGWRLTALCQRQWNPTGTFLEEQQVTTYPRGYAATGGSLGAYLARTAPTQARVGADYLMAVLPLDWSGLGPVAYVKNFEVGLHGESGFFFPEGKAPATLLSAGASLSVRLGNLLWIPFDTRIGASWSYNFGPSFGEIRAAGVPLERHYVGVLFSIDY